jgi:beta-glucosidase
MGKEFRGKGKHQALGPCLDLDRDPRNGRSPETGGEDPYLNAQITSAVVQGIQMTPCIATIKHYNVNHRESGRESNNIFATQRILHEDAGLTFRTAVQQGGALCVMNAYNLINGQKCAENPNLLTMILRIHWGFPYYVVSDWGSIWNSEQAIKAGCDICMGSNKYQVDLPTLVAGGAVPESVIDNAVRRVLRTKIIAGMLDYLPPGNPADVNSAEHQQLALEAGRKSLVLLKNKDNILPLDTATVRTVALIGPSAAVLPVDGSGSSYVTPFYTVTPRQGIERKIGAARVLYTKGCDINSSDTSGFATAVAYARLADVVVFCGGLDPSQEGEGFDRVGGSINLPGKQQDLINVLAASNPRVIVTLFSGGVCGIGRSIDNMKGLIYGFYPGQEGGRALADVLFGDVNPGGKLPVTMPKSDSQLPPWNDDLTDDYGAGYRWFDTMGYTPQFAFGFGLSYTTFSYNNLRLSPVAAAPGQPVGVSVDVKNVGARTGDEVVQLYLTHSNSPVTMPPKQLRAFRRVSLAPGQTSTVSFTLTADELYYYSESAGRYDVHAGEYVVRVGGSSDNLPLEGRFQVLDGPRKPDLVLTSVKMVPPYPVPGQKVIFLATVKNQGTAPTTAGIPLKIGFSMNGQQVSWSDDFTDAIPPGGMGLIMGNKGPGGVNSWTAVAVGSYTIEAVADPDNAVHECDETNNALTAQRSVYQAPLPNLALRKTVSVTSSEGPGYGGENAVDGNMGTRWSSMYSDPQALVIDLGAKYYVSDIALYWEYAYAKEYIIKVLTDGTNWVDVWHEVDGKGGLECITLGVNARKIMLLGLQRATQYGYSLYEFEVHGGIATGIENPAGSQAVPLQITLNQNYPNPFSAAGGSLPAGRHGAFGGNPTTAITYHLPPPLPEGQARQAGLAVNNFVTLRVYDLLGREVATLVNEELPSGTHTVRWNGGGLPSGIYFYQLKAGSFQATKKMILLE